VGFHKPDVAKNIQTGTGMQGANLLVAPEKPRTMK
jgi:hypothetical protein